ncbi:MAG TPA: response regulator [Puia sp.]|nr:response regulator [Puia sp.]
MAGKILMVEHDQDDRWLTEETFQSEGFEGGIDFIYPAELTAYLQHSDNRPALILLDMNAQPFDGMDLIHQIRDTEGYEKTPLIVLSESVLPGDVLSSYAAGATSFIQKPASYHDTLFKIRSFINYWFRTVELPA